MKWLRLYVDILDDEKIARMSDRTYRIFTYLLLLSREREQEGTIDMSLGDVAWRLRMPEKDIAKAIADLKALNILFEDNSSIQFINWSKRQFRSDDVNSRVQRFRGKKINKHETFHETLRETLDVTAPETETETETETEKKPPLPPLRKGGNGFSPPDWVPRDAWDAFIESRKRQKGGITDRAKELIVLQLDKLRQAGHDPEAVLNQSVAMGWKGVFPIRDGPLIEPRDPDSWLKNKLRTQGETDDAH